MARKVLTIIKLQVPAGQANPAPPVGPALGQHGVNIMEFCKDYNARTTNQAGQIIPAQITIFEDRSFTFILKTPPSADLLRKAAGVEKGSSTTSREVVGSVTRAQVREAVERAGDDHWEALIRHHEDAYPESRPTPGDVCLGEAERLNQLGLGDAQDLTLVETRVERTDSTVRIVHLFEYGPHSAHLLTEPFEGYGDEPG